MNAQLCSITIVFIELCLFIPFTITLKVTCLYCLQTNSNGQRLFADQIFTLLMLFVHQCFFPLVIKLVWLTWSEIWQVPVPIPCDVPGAICKNACAAGATDAEVDGDIKYWSSLRQRGMVGRSRGWRDTQDGKLLLVLAAKRYVISVLGWLASWVLVCCDFRGHQKCDDSNFALIWTLPLSVIVLRMVWLSFLEYWVTEILLWCSLCPGYWDCLDYWNISTWTAVVYRLLWNLGFFNLMIHICKCF